VSDFEDLDDVVVFPNAVVNEYRSVDELTNALATGRETTHVGKALQLIDVVIQRDAKLRGRFWKVRPRVGENLIETC
jgi:hypothetical protein